MDSHRISVVTPTLDRPIEVQALLQTLAAQTLPPYEVVLVDGAPAGMEQTCQAIAQIKTPLPYRLIYLRHGGGTAIQRNIGIDHAAGDFIAFIDDDMRLEPDYFEKILKVFDLDEDQRIGGIAGYITNQYLDPKTSGRWKWYRRLHLFSTYEPGKYDYQTGYPINRYTRAPHQDMVDIDFMGSNCAVWRREVFADGLRFDKFFSGYGILEDAHLALRARRQWRLVEFGLARCQHLHSPRGREDTRKISLKTVTNYRYVFLDVVPERTLRQEFGFWRFQFIDLAHLMIYAVMHPQSKYWLAVLGKMEGIKVALFMKSNRAPEAK